jgi:hypothetical protein
LAEAGDGTSVEALEAGAGSGAEDVLESPEQAEKRNAAVTRVADDMRNLTE